MVFTITGAKNIVRFIEGFVIFRGSLNLGSTVVRFQVKPAMLSFRLRYFITDKEKHSVLIIQQTF